MTATNVVKPPGDVKTMRESDAEYHAKNVYRGGRYLSSHALIDMLESPAVFNGKRTGLVRDTDSDAYRAGRAAHCRILEGPEAYRKRYTFGGPVNDKTGSYYGQQTKAYAEWRAGREAEGLEVLPDSDDALCELLAAGVALHQEAMTLLQAGQPEQVARANYCGVPCQIKVDWLREDGIIDLKTCRDIKRFAHDFYEYHYDNQMSFYQKVMEAHANARLPVMIIAVEKAAPHRAALYEIEQAVLDKAQMENERAIQRLRECIRTGLWPTGCEGVQKLAAREGRP